MRNSLIIISCLLLGVLLSSFGCSSDSSASPSGSTDAKSDVNGNKGGSTARFSLKGNHLFVISGNREITSFDVSSAGNPVNEGNTNVGADIETLFPKDSLLFVGSQWGMYIYDVSNPASPQYISQFNHVFSCDPVVADNDYAYVTLRANGNNCGRFSNELQVLDISNLHSPQQVGVYAMEGPNGLGKSGDKLFVCDDGLKVFDAQDPTDLNLTQHFTDIQAFDVIPNSGVLMAIAPEAFRQYDIRGDSITLLSTIDFN